MIGKIDVTIPTKNSERTIAKYIEHVKKYIPHNRIIIIDDSDDKTLEIAEKMGVEVHRIPVNMGGKRYYPGKLAKTKWITTLDSDVYVYPNWYGILSKEVEKYKVDFIGGLLDGTTCDIFPEYIDFDLFNTLHGREGSVPGGNALVKRQIFIDTKEIMFSVDDPRGVGFGEEASALGKVVKDKGYKPMVIPIIIAYDDLKNPLLHHQYSYFGRSEGTRARYSFVRGLLTLFKAAICGFLYKWLRYLIHKKKFYFKLLFYLFSCYLSYCCEFFGIEKGIHDFAKIFKKYDGIAEKYLFRIDAGLENELNKSIILNKLKDVFKTKGFSLSDNTVVTKGKENKWMINDETSFIIRKKDENLHIYEG